jgi:hypothetical protein
MPRVTYDLTPPPGAPTASQPSAQGSPVAPGSDTAAQPGVTTDPGASNKQLDFIRDLLKQREIGEEAQRALEARVAVQQELNDKHGDRCCPLAAAGLTKVRATTFIDRLLKAPRRAPQRGKTRDIMGENDPRKVHADLPSPDDLPAGYYAIKNAEGQLRFYHVWRGDKVPTYVKLYLIHGTSSTEIKYGSHEFVAILRAIVVAEPFKASMMYGQHIGTCGADDCGRRLTNRVSRLLGIGPVCGSHHCDPAVWKRMKAQARAALEAAGLDPSADVEDTDDLAAIREAAGLAL